MAWRAPYRPSGEISQSYNDGMVTIYAVEDSAAVGYQPKIKLVVPAKAVLRYDEQRVGVTRYYNARQNQIQVERVLRVPRAGGVTNQDVAMTEDGRYYRIDQVQSVPDVWPASLDLTLAKFEQEAVVTDVV